MTELKPLFDRLDKHGPEDAKCWPLARHPSSPLQEIWPERIALAPTTKSTCA